MGVAVRLRSTRLDADLTQAGLAARSGVTLASVAAVRDNGANRLRKPDPARPGARARCPYRNPVRAAVDRQSCQTGRPAARSAARPPVMTDLLDVQLEIGARRLKVGRLAWRDRRALFEYAPEFLDAKLPISPLHLPLNPGVQTAPREPFAGLFGVFADNLPESYGRLLLDRRLRALGRDPNALTPLDRLALVGEGGFGALRYMPADAIAEETLQMPDLDRLQAEALVVIAGEPSEMLGALQRLGAAPGVARPKAQVWLGADDASLSTAPGPGLEPWLVKFRAPGDPGGYWRD